MKNAPSNKPNPFQKLLLLILIFYLPSHISPHIYYSNQCANLISPIDIMSPITYLDFTVKIIPNSISTASVIKLPNLSEISFSEELFNNLDKKQKDAFLKKEYTPFTFKISTGNLLDNKSVDTFGEIFYDKFKYSIRNIYVKFPSEHMIAGLGFSMELQFEAFTAQDQSLIFVKLFEGIEDFENPVLEFLDFNSWSMMKDYQTMPLEKVDFTKLFNPNEEVLSSITGDIDYIPKTMTDEILEYSEMIPNYYNEKQPPFREEKDFYFYTGQATSGDCEYALIFVSRVTELIGLSQFGLMGIKSQGLTVRNMLSRKLSVGVQNNPKDSEIEIDHSSWQNIPDVFANFFYDDKFGDVSSLGKKIKKIIFFLKNT
jgi:hypothetical protein